MHLSLGFSFIHCSATDSAGSTWPAVPPPAKIIVFITSYPDLPLQQGHGAQLLGQNLTLST